MPAYRYMDARTGASQDIRLLGGGISSLGPVAASDASLMHRRPTRLRCRQTRKTQTQLILYVRVREGFADPLSVILPVLMK